MILPTKHVPTKESYIGLGAEILSRLQTPKYASELWVDVRTSGSFAGFDHFSLVLTFLFLVNAIRLSSGRLEITK